MSSHGSVSEWIFGLKSGDSEALEKIIRRYQSDVLAEAKRRLRSVSAATNFDEADVSQDVWISVWKASEAGRLGFVTDRERLWPLLVVITNHKTVDRGRRELAAKRGGPGGVVNEASLAGGLGREDAFSLDQLVGDQATPEFLATVSEEYSRLMNVLRDDTLRLIAKSRFEGFKDAEIAEHLSTSLRTVERKLGLIRDCWKLEADSTIHA